MKSITKIIISTLFILAIIATFWSATSAEEGFIQKQLDVATVPSFVGSPPPKITPVISSFDCFEPSWHQRTTCSVMKGFGQYEHTCYGNTYCATSNIGGDSIPKCEPKWCDG